MTDKEITILYQPNKKDLLKASKHILFTRTPFKFFPFFVLFLFIAQILPDILNKADNGSDMITMENIIPVLGLIPAIALAYIIFSYSIKKNLEANPKNFEPQKLHFDNQGFSQNAASFTNNYKWSDIDNITETEEWFLIFLNKNNAVPVFKKQITAQEHNDLKNLFRSLNIKKSLK
ncbi:YcxB family protein [Flavobacterium pedocola]